MENPVVVFDGVCNLCNAFVSFILRHEKDQRIIFYHLQSAQAKILTAPFNLPLPAADSVVYISEGKAFTQSRAVFEIARHLKPPYRYVSIFSILPLSVTDFLYGIVSRYRYKLFGRNESCILPDEKYRSRIVI